MNMEMLSITFLVECGLFIGWQFRRTLSSQPLDSAKAVSTSGQMISAPPQMVLVPISVDSQPPVPRDR